VVADSFGLAILPEVHDTYATHERLSSRGFWTYDFVLPGLLLHAFDTGETERLADHLAKSPARQFTNLDCHDGIPVRPDLDGILTPPEMAHLAEQVRQRGGNVNHILSETHAEDGDVHQLNCTYYSALDDDDERYVAARAIQLFARGVPQIYYVGLLAGMNDRDAFERTGEGRAVNRHDYTSGEIQEALGRSVVGRVIDLVRLRNRHPAFDGELIVENDDGATIRLEWRHGGEVIALIVDLAQGYAALADRGRLEPLADWATSLHSRAT